MKAYKRITCCWSHLLYRGVAREEGICRTILTFAFCFSKKNETASSLKKPNPTQNLRAADKDYSVLMKSESSSPEEHQRFFCELGGQELWWFVACLAFWLLLASRDKNHAGFHPQILDAYFVSFYMWISLSEFDKKMVTFKRHFLSRKSCTKEYRTFSSFFVHIVRVWDAC